MSALGQKRTCAAQKVMSALCQKQTFAGRSLIDAKCHNRTLSHAEIYGVTEHGRYKPSVTSAQPRMVLLLRNARTVGSMIAGRSCATTTVATMASQ